MMYMKEAFCGRVSLPPVLVVTPEVVPGLPADPPRFPPSPFPGAANWDAAIVWVWLLN
jgi:hypothetical protein